MPLNMHYLDAVRATAKWAALLEKDEAEQWQSRDRELTGIIQAWLAPLLQDSGWESAGYHAAVLGLRLDLVPDAQVAPAVEFIKAHMLRCFPNNPDAPRLSDPAVSDPQMITPYFGHYAMPVLIEQGEMPFVLDQYRICWGWMLQQAPTWIEVFDTRWSHSHQWAGCPTWQLSRYLSGLHPRYDLGARHFEWRFSPGELHDAEVRVPLPDGSVVTVQWEREGDSIDLRCKTPAPIVVHFPPGSLGPEESVVEIDGEWEQPLRLTKDAGVIGST
jgi:hypothetical protein